MQSAKIKVSGNETILSISHSVVVERTQRKEARASKANKGRKFFVKHYLFINQTLEYYRIRPR